LTPFFGALQMLNMKHWHATFQVATAIASQDDWQCQTIKLSLPQLNICAGAIINASICVDPTVDGKLMLRFCRLLLTVCVMQENGADIVSRLFTTGSCETVLSPMCAYMMGELKPQVFCRQRDFRHEFFAFKKRFKLLGLQTNIEHFILRILKQSKGT
jgi:hypothetical protein